MKPLFIWAGGKNKMLHHYVPLLPKSINSYSEPFFGGGAMFLHVMAKYSPEKSYINDINPGIISVYQSVRDNLNEFLSIIENYEEEYLKLPITTRIPGEKTKRGARWHYYMNLRNQHAYQYADWSAVMQSATLYFLMKTGFNGLWQVNKNTNNRYGTPAGQKTEVVDKENVKNWHHLLNDNDITITCQDWSQCQIADFTFFDPPYRDSFTDYASGFNDREQEKLLLVASTNPGKTVWICNREAGDGFFDDRGLIIDRFPITYTAGRRKQEMVNGEMTYTAKEAVEILIRNKTEPSAGVLQWT